MHSVGRFSFCFAFCDKKKPQFIEYLKAMTAQCEDNWKEQFFFVCLFSQKVLSYFK